MNETVKSKEEQRSNGLIATGMLVIALVLVMAFVFYRSKPTTDMKEMKFSDMTMHEENAPMALEKAQQRIATLEANNTDLKNKLDTEMTKQAEQQQIMTERMNQLEAQNRAVTTTYPHNESIEQVESQKAIDTSIHEIRLNLSKKEETKTFKKNVYNYVPSGTFAKAVMIGGADANAAVQSQALLSPMVFRIVENGTMPNHQKSHLKNCVVTGAVFGDISSERGLIRTEQLSCIYPNGKVIDVKVEGAIFGPDGKNGVRGNPVWREKALLQRAFTAGALSGFAQGITNSYSTQSVSPEGVVTAIKTGKVFQAAGAEGLAKGMEKLADYNIQRAEQYHPVIQLSAGTVVDVVFIHGFYLDEEDEIKKDETPLYQSEIKNPWGFADVKDYQALRGAS